jgi:hypothetical protein
MPFALLIATNHMGLLLIYYYLFKTLSHKDNSVRTQHNENMENETQDLKH